MNNTNNTAQMIPDGTYRCGAPRMTLDVVNGIATVQPEHWCDYEDGSHGTTPAERMSAARVALYCWWKDGVGYGAAAE